MGHSFQPVGAEIVIIGGGPAGAGLAIELSRAGRDVLLVEREAGPHDKVCGEFLSHEALVSLDALGIDAEALGAVPISKLSLAAGEREVNITLPFPAPRLPPPGPRPQRRGARGCCAARLSWRRDRKVMAGGCACGMGPRLRRRSLSSLLGSTIC